MHISQINTICGYFCKILTDIINGKYRNFEFVFIDIYNFTENIPLSLILEIAGYVSCFCTYSAAVIHFLDLFMKIYNHNVCSKLLDF